MPTTRREFIKHMLVGTAGVSAIPLLAVSSIALHEYEPPKVGVGGPPLHGSLNVGDVRFDTRPAPEGQKLYVYTGNGNWARIDSFGETP